MKKIYLSVIAIAILAINNQSNAQQGFSLSVLATPQFSFLQNKNDNSNSNIEREATFRANFGLGANYNFTEHSGLGIDVLYSFQGQRYEIRNAESGNSKTFQQNDYIKIPLHYTYSYSLSSAISLIGKIGPQVSILTRSRLKDDNDNIIKSDTKGFYKDVTFGGMAAAGAQFKINEVYSITSMFRFDYDISNAEDELIPGYNSGRPNTHNITMGLEIGLKYAFH